MRDPADDIRSDESELIRCGIALGSVRTGFLFLTREEIEHFALRTVRRSIIQTIESLGFIDASNEFDDWFGQAGPPPRALRPGAPSVTRIVSLLLAEHASCPWAPLSEAAMLTRRLGPHLVNFNPLPEADEEAKAQRALIDARALLGPAIAPSMLMSEEDHALHKLFTQLSRAARSDSFALSEQGNITLNTPAGVRSVATGLPTSHPWALGLHVGTFLQNAGMFPAPIPLPSSVTSEILRLDLSRSERKSALHRRLASAAESSLQDMIVSRKNVANAGKALAGTRSTSRAGAVFRIIAGLGPVRSQQIAKGLSMSPRGAQLVLSDLVTRGLATTSPSGYFSVNVGRAEPQRETDEVAGRDTNAVREFDEAMAHLDRILQQNPTAQT